jgi:hypothetical protein
MLQIIPNYNTKPVSQGDHSNPVVLVVDGTNGEYVAERLFLHNDDVGRYYTNITVQVGNIPAGSTIKLLAQKDRPAEADWSAATAAVGIANIGSAARADLDYHPFWIFYQVPKGTPAKTWTGAFFQILYAENQR